MNEHFSLRIPNSLAAIPDASDRATSWLEANGVSSAAAFLANLAIEELVTNCIKYAYADKAEHMIDIELSIANRQLTLRVTDDGQAFDPVHAPVPDVSLPPEQRELGGLGLHLLRTMSDSMTYERLGDRNQLTLVKAID